MRILCKSEINQDRLQRSLNRIKFNTDSEIIKLIESVPLIITDEDSVDAIYTNPLLKKALAGSFGAIKGNIIYEGMKIHLVVINLSNIDKMGLLEDELDGAMSHELGHIFNDLPEQEFPKFDGTPEWLAASQEAKKQANIDGEIYADYFSKITKTDKGLLSSMKKYLSLPGASNLDMFELRISKLQSDEEFIGIVKKIK